MDLCAACGIIAPTEQASCSGCKAVFPSPRLQVAEREDDAYWVSVHCELRCGKCYGRSPRNHLDASGVATCVKCGTTEPFLVREWAPVFEHAHAVGDLAGPDPQGRTQAGGNIGDENPFQSLGIELSAASFGEQSGHTFVSASPGSPLCTRCHVPIELPLDTIDADTLRATSTCPSCKETTRYELPKSAREAYPALQMVLAEGNRVDHALAVSDPRAQGWWLLFRGPSPKRRALESLFTDGVVEDEDERASEPPESKHRKKKDDSAGNNVLFVIMALCVLAGGAVAAYSMIESAIKEVRPEKAADDPAVPHQMPSAKPGAGHATHGGSH